MFISTFIIGLREGLEAALIVGILAAFLRKNRCRLGPLFLGTGLALLISLGVGVGLELTSRSLPQAEQEMLETVIGLVAVCFVTTMILWMNRHAHQLKQELEAEAHQAIKQGSAYSLALMAFLAVLKEGFETAVFLLAIFSTTSSSKTPGVVGAALGICLAVGIGWGIYRGGIHLNLRVFFRSTAIFLVFVAAGLLFQVLRTAHEAGWVSLGQAQVADLSSLFPATSVWGALFTGLFGIETDPRLIEVLAWGIYLVVTLSFCLFSESVGKWLRHRFTPRERRRLFWALEAGICLLALLLFLFTPRINVYASSAEEYLSTSGSGLLQVTSRLESDTLQVTVTNAGQTDTYTLEKVDTAWVNEVEVTYWQYKSQPQVLDGLNETPSLSDLVSLNQGKIPAGLNRERTPGPFAASYTTTTSISVHSIGSRVCYYKQDVSTNAYLSGGGISDSKVVSLSYQSLQQETTAEEEILSEAVQQLLQSREQALYYAWLPALLVTAAAGILLIRWSTSRHRRGKAAAYLSPRDTIPNSQPTTNPGLLPH